MALTANPFHPITGELLSSYRDAYLRGDLSEKNAGLVDNYLKRNAHSGIDAFQRFHTLQAQGHQVQPVGWLAQQLALRHTAPARFRQRGATLLLGTVLASGAVFASTRLPAEASSPLLSTEAASELHNTASAPEALRLKVVTGRVLNENGQPLAGATILHKASGRGVATDAQGHYSLAVPAGLPAQLQVAYAGYNEVEAIVRAGSTCDATLAPDPTRKKHRWWLLGN